MPRVNYRGARGANAGDDFHELWALRQVLALLEQNSALLAVTVEGLRDEDERGAPRETWDGVDCALYYGATTADRCDKIIVDQLKYSGSNPKAPWTLARLTKSTNKKANNSVLGRLADAFNGLVEKRGGRADAVSLRLVSNQPVDPRAIEVVGNIATASKATRASTVREHKRVMQATGLDGEFLQTFANALDLSCRTGSRFELEESILKSVSGWGDDDVRGTINVLLDFIRRKMLPEAQGEPITAETVLVQLGFSSRRALFPCPAELKQIDEPVPREVAGTIVKRLVSGEQFLCLHGPAGCGKTTVLQEVGANLPTGSAMVVFDCYGAGRYLDSDAYRHRPKDAFLQLSNELAVRLQIPLLLTRSKDTDYPRSFAERLNRSAAAIAVRGRDALLVIAVDAAENSVTAANSLVPPEPSFVRDFVNLGGIAANARLVVTGRTSGLTEIATPPRFEHVPMSGFTQTETAQYVRRMWKNPPNAWIEDFHHFSGGNPRVQSYALAYGAGDPGRALDYLRPRGKALGEVFDDLLNDALLKSGGSAAINAFCGALVALPRPIPLDELAAASELSLDQARDICTDLAPGIRFLQNGVGFADEDFEQFIRGKVDGLLRSIRSRVAQRFLERRHTDAYAAAHLATALYHAGRGKEIIEIIETEFGPGPIRDPVLWREVQVQRLRVAVRISSEHEDTADAVRTILVGAEAVKSDAAIRELVVANPDLAAAFMRDSAMRLVLLNAKEIERHGPLLFHLMLEDAREGNLIAAREDHRQLRAWLSRRNDDLVRQRAQGKGQDAWAIRTRDVAAEVEAALLTAGPKAAVAVLRSWRPRTVGLSVARILIPRLITSGKAQLVEQCLDGDLIAEPWSILLLVPLALSGRGVDTVRLERALARTRRHGIISLDRLRDDWNAENTAYWLDMVLAACEMVIAHGGNRERVLPVLALFSEKRLRRFDRLFTSQSHLLDLLLRAHSLMERVECRAITSKSFVAEPDEVEGTEPDQTARKSSRDRDDDRKKELEDFVGPLIGLYDARAQILLDNAQGNDAGGVLSKAAASFKYESWRFATRRGAQRMRRRAALSIANLLYVRNTDGAALLEMSLAVLGDQDERSDGDEIAVLSTAVLNRAVQEKALAVVFERADLIRALKTVARDKISSMISLARFLVPVSRNEARALFMEAHTMSKDLDVDALHQVECLAALAVRAASGANRAFRRSTAVDLMSVVADAAIRLSDQEGFPWQRVAEALTCLDLPLALAAVARWEDSGVAGRDSCLGTVLQTALRMATVTATQVAALMPLLHSPKLDVLRSVVHALDGLSRDTKNTVLEELARDALLGCSSRPCIDAVDVLEEGGTPHEDRGLWWHHLEKRLPFYHGLPSGLPAF